MKRHLLFPLMFLLLPLFFFFGCSSGNTDAPTLGPGSATTEVHASGWISFHGDEANADLRGCQGCHGFDFKGSGDAVSCFNCHSSGPPFVGVHPNSWNADPLQGHQLNFENALSDQTPWTTCAVAACHGATLEGGTVAPTCQNNTANCHPTGTNGWPPAPANHSTFNVAAASTDAVHGRAAKGETESTLSMGNYCLLCHGIQPNNFSGGFVSDAAIMNNLSGNCAAASCHPTATAHPSNWVSTRPGNNVFHNNNTLTDSIKNESCSLCHTTTGQSPSSPFGGAPTCFDATFNGLTCHANGPGSAPHDSLASTGVDYLPAGQHGPAAKADMVGCQVCHATAGGAGSNPRFNLPKGTMTNGCEDCHTKAGAHPTQGVGSDRWTFNLETSHALKGTTLDRRTHFATSARVSTDCVLCHNVNDTNTGSGTALGCNTCHVSTSTFSLDCTFCHEAPPDTGTPNLTGATLVDHIPASGDLAAITNHEDCSICHGASENGSTGTLQAKSADYTLFAGTGQGGNHLDGLIETNLSTGYVDITGRTAERFGCNAACHPNDATHQLSDAGLGTETGNYTTGTIACNDCHGYPPDGVTAAPGAAVASHVGALGADLLTFHGECQTCHGTKDSGAGSHEPHVNYTPATDHYNGQINMNSATNYNAINGGCDNAVCHGNDLSHRVPPTSGLTVQGGDYGTGSCSACHAYPPDGVSAPLTAPAGTLAVNHLIFDATGNTIRNNHGDCQTCHGTKDTSGAHDSVSPYVPATHHRDGQIQMNSDAGYNATNFGCDSAGCHLNDGNHQLSDSNLPVQLLALGGSGTCDTCHDGLPTDGTPISSNAHTAHISSTTSVSLLCNACHGHNGSGVTHNEGSGTVILANVDIVFTGIANSGTFSGEYSGPATKQCSNVYCHGAANTPDWDAGTGGACGDCHGAAVTGRPDADNEPSGGSHLTSSHAAAACTACHTHDGTTGTSISEHVNGPANANGDALVSTGGANITAYTFGATSGTSPDPDGFRYTQSTCTASCHGSGTWGGSGGCNFCHGYPPDGTGGSTDHLTRTGFGSTNAEFYSAHGICSTCHGVSGNQTPPTAATARTGAIDLSATGGDAYIEAMHNDGVVQMNGAGGANSPFNENAGYSELTNGCTQACHAATVKFSGTIQDNTIELREFGSGDCTACHDGSGTGALAVSINSSHSELSTFYSCEQCHTSHGAGDVEIPNNPAVGINYTANGEGGISLSDPIGAATTEAEICWNCHNTFAVPADWRNGGDFNGFSISSRDWTAANFNAPGSAIPNREVVSIHSVNSSAESSSVANNVDASGRTSNHASFTGTFDLEPAAAIRCSYCHDVHDLNLASNDSTSGTPYLRGSWLTNPYPLERPPESGDTYTNNNWGQRNNLPRLFADSTGSASVGGFFIDQNSSWPTRTGSSYMTVSATAGICVLCHGSNTDTMDYYAGSSLWNGANNGHKNSTLGGSGGAGNNLFDARRNTSGGTAYMQAQGASTAIGSEWGNSSKRKKLMPDSNTFEGDKPARSGTAPPRNTGWYAEGQAGINIRGGSYTSWYGTGVGDDGDGNTPNRAHNFSCSKCHTPHASGLPALLITNCLDYRIGTWAATMSAKDTGNVTVGPTATNNWAEDLMGNCHRKESTSTGWNDLAPIQ